jgi:hypothetical protein
MMQIESGSDRFKHKLQRQTSNSARHTIDARSIDAPWMRACTIGLRGISLLGMYVEFAV